MVATKVLRFFRVRRSNCITLKETYRMKTKNIFRTLLMAVGLLVGIESAQATEKTIWDSGTAGEIEILSDKFEGVPENAVLRVYADAEECYIYYVENYNWHALWATPDYENNDYIRTWNSDYFAQYYDSVKKCFFFKLTADKLSILQNNNLGVRVKNITKVTLETEGEIVVVPKYTLTYVSQGETLKTERLEAGATPTPPADPIRYDGWTFDSWENLPTTMPANDLTVTAKFLAPMRQVFWILNWDETIRTDNVREGDPIPNAPSVSRSGYIFNGWKYYENSNEAPIPTVMPSGSNISIYGTTTKNIFTVTFVIGGQTIESKEVENGTSIVPPVVDVPEGKRLVWGENGWYPSTVNGADVEIQGQYVDLKKFTLTFKVDDEVYKTVELYEGTEIVPGTDPEKDGYTFSGWDWLPSTMPSANTTITGRFIKNEMPTPTTWQESSLTYVVPAGEKYTSGQTITLNGDNEKTAVSITFGEEGGADFTAAVADGAIDGFVAFTGGNGVDGNKEGGTFYTITPQYDGFIAVGVVLNANKDFYILEDGVSLTDYNGFSNNTKYKGAYGFNVKAGSTYKIYALGSKLGFYGFKYDYTVTKYTITYLVDGRAYSFERLEEGMVPTPPMSVTKPGYTLTGWSGVPEKMPAEAVEATALFQINSYKLTYEVNGSVVGEDTYEYGATIEPREKPTQSGYHFVGWSNLPQTMPAYDVTVTGRLVRDTQYITATISSSTGYASFCSDQPLDFSKVTDLKAYIATAIGTDVVSLEQVTGIIPAGTGLIIKGQTASIPVADTDGSAPSGNLLVGVTYGTKYSQDAKEYVLTEVNGVARFAATEGYQAEITAGHAYLQAPSSNARALRIVINETTGINVAPAQVGETPVVYNLQGRRVTNPKKGELYIINGKKTIMK